MKWILPITVFLMAHNITLGQNKGNVWCFGDSAGIDFTIQSSPVPIISSVDSRGSCVSISDSLGNLLFYANTFYDSLYELAYNQLAVVYNKFGQVMQGGDSIIGEAWYQELVIIPIPQSPDLYYLFSIGSAGYGPDGLYYSIIDMSQNGGLGKVVQKNIQLSALPAFDGLTTVKHGNGRDWWLIFKLNGQRNPANNDFIIYFIDPLGIHPQPVQSIGYIITTGGGCISFNKSGDKILMTDWKNLIQVMDFDRCTGVLSNANVIEPENNFQFYEHFRSCFSPSGELIYLTHIPQTLGDSTHFLFQYNLLAGNILSSRDTIYQTNFPNLMAGLQLAPDNKIYVSTWFNCGGFCFPYPDSVRNLYNENLGVINYPDNLGLSCNFQPYSFYLGGKRTYIGLPNNPDYELGPLIGRGCDSLPLEVTQTVLPKTQLHLFYHTSWQTLFINAEGLTGKTYLLNIYNLTGKVIYSEKRELAFSTFIREINCSSFLPGMYLVTLQTANDFLSKKFIRIR